MYDFLKEFESPEGHWDDFDILKPIVIHLYNKYGIETILEIGFNIGHSATLFLDYCPDKKSKVTSVDLGIHKDTIKASEAVKGHFGDRFRFHLLNSKYMENTLKHDTFDLAFIDGDHTHQGVQNDIQSCINLKIPYLLFDDWHTYDEHGRYTNGVKTTCDMFEKAGKISKVEIFDLKYDTDKLALYKNDTIYSTKKLLTRQVQLLSPKRD
tara:strand:- start:800 stop:1429 length:630 start_codon:yes stop_codon:yes gene_type:complete